MLFLAVFGWIFEVKYFWMTTPSCIQMRAECNFARRQTKCCSFISCAAPLREDYAAALLFFFIFFSFSVPLTFPLAAWLLERLPLLTFLKDFFWGNLFAFRKNIKNLQRRCWKFIWNKINMCILQNFTKIKNGSYKLGQFKAAINLYVSN